MHTPTILRVQRCRDLQSIIDCILSRSLALTGAEFGNVQPMDWRTGNLTIAGQHGKVIVTNPGGGGSLVTLY
jgi:hypothetical protein